MMKIAVVLAAASFGQYSFSNWLPPLGMARVCLEPVHGAAGHPDAADLAPAHAQGP
jgi:hypothetical protein